MTHFTTWQDNLSFATQIKISSGEIEEWMHKINVIWSRFAKMKDVFCRPLSYGQGGSTFWSFVYVCFWQLFLLVDSMDTGFSLINITPIVHLGGGSSTESQLKKADAWATLSPKWIVLTTLLSKQHKVNSKCKMFQGSALVGPREVGLWKSQEVFFCRF